MKKPKTIKRKKRTKNIRKIQCSHGTYYVSLPINLVRELNWRERQKVVVKKRGKSLIIKDWEK